MKLKLLLVIKYTTNFYIFLERNPSPDAFDKKPMSRSMNPPVPTNRWSVSPTNTPASIQPVQR